MQAVAQPFFRLARTKVTDLEAGIGRVAAEGERMHGRAEVRGAEAEGVDVFPAAVRAADIVGNAAGTLAADLVDQGADHRVIVDEAGRLGRVAAGQETLVAAAMIGKIVR